MASPPHLPWWAPFCRPGVRAAAEALFPPNDLGAPDWRQTDLVERTLAYTTALPPPQRRQIIALYTAIHILPLLSASALLPFSWLSAERRTEVVRGWRTSSLFALRLLGDAVKATLTMVYMQHAAVLRFMGVYSVCDNPADDYRAIEVRPEGLARLAEDASS